MVREARHPRRKDGSATHSWHGGTDCPTVEVMMDASKTSRSDSGARADASVLWGGVARLLLRRYCGFRFVPNGACVLRVQSASAQGNTVSCFGPWPAVAAQAGYAYPKSGSSCRVRYPWLRVKMKMRNSPWARRLRAWKCRGKHPWKELRYTRSVHYSAGMSSGSKSRREALRARARNTGVSDALMSAQHNTRRSPMLDVSGVCWAGSTHTS